GLRVLIEMMERKHYQQSFALMRATLARLPDAIVITDASHADWRQCQVVFVNDAFVRATGHAADSVSGLPIGGLLASDASALDRLTGTVDADEAARIPVSLRKADGGTLPGRLELEPVADATGTITHWMSVHHSE
ncbi:MAG: PAS domain-containing protein, partial [Luteibacter sp.]